MSNNSYKYDLRSLIQSQLVLTSVGVPPNIIALTYFLLKEDGKLPNILIRSLIISDLLFLVVNHAYELCFFTYGVYVECYYLTPVMVTTNYVSSLLTCVLTITRSITVSKPLVIVSKGKVIRVVTVLSVFLAMESIPFYNKRYGLKDSSLRVLEIIGTVQVATEIFLIIFSSAIMIYHLYKKPAILVNRQESREEANRNISATILLISVVFVITNGVGFVFVSLEDKDDPSTWFIKAYFFVSNSLLNPIIYIVRLKKLREFTKFAFLWPIKAWRKKSKIRPSLN